MMVGRQLRHDVQRSSHRTDRGHPRGSPPLHAPRASRTSASQLHKGEVLGVYGLMGSGRTELARALFGADMLLSGEILVNGRPVRLNGVADGKRAGIGLVPEERSQASFPFLTIRENVTVASADLISDRTAGSSRAASERSPTRSSGHCACKAPDIEELLGRLSGGNQQKVIVGRWLLRESPILLLDDPTAGRRRRRQGRDLQPHRGHDGAGHVGDHVLLRAAGAAGHRRPHAHPAARAPGGHARGHLDEPARGPAAWRSRARRAIAWRRADAAVVRPVRHGRPIGPRPPRSEPRGLRHTGRPPPRGAGRSRAR